MSLKSAFKPTVKPQGHQVLGNTASVLPLCVWVVSPSQISREKLHALLWPWQVPVAFRKGHRRIP